MKVNEAIRKRIRRSGDGVNVVGDVNAAVTGRVGEGSTSGSRVVSRQRIVQRNGETTEHSVQSSNTEIDRDGK
jgi:hypothetical protein